MPKVYLSDRERLCQKLGGWVYGQMKIHRMTQSDMARELGISQQAFSLKMRICRFSYEDYLTFVRIFKPSQEELLWFIT